MSSGNDNEESCRYINRKRGSAIGRKWVRRLGKNTTCTLDSEGRKGISRGDGEVVEDGECMYIYIYM